MIVEELFSRLGLEIDEVAFEKADALIEGVHEGLLKLGVAAAGVAAVGLAFMVNQTAEAGEAALHLAQSTGISTDHLQELGYAAKISKVPVDQLAVAMRFMARQGVRDVNGEMERLAGQFSKMPDGGAKVQLAMLRMGRQGAALIPMLNKGSEYLKKMRLEAHATGNVMSKESLESAEHYRESIERLGLTFVGLRNQMATPFLDSFANAIDWVIEHSDGLIVAFKWLGIALVGIGIAFGILEGEAVGAAIAAAAAWVVAALPVVLLGLAIGAVILIVQDLWTFLRGGDSIIGRLVEKWKSFFHGFTEGKADDPWWLTMLRAAAGFMSDLIEGLPFLFKALGGVKDKVVDWIGSHGAKGGGIAAVDDAAKGADARGIGAALMNPSAAFGSAGQGPLRSAVGRSQTSTKVWSPNFNAAVTVHAQTNASASDIAGHVHRAVKESHQAMLREAAAGM